MGFGNVAPAPLIRILFSTLALMEFDGELQPAIIRAKATAPATHVSFIMFMSPCLGMRSALLDVGCRPGQQIAQVHKSHVGVGIFRSVRGYEPGVPEHIRILQHQLQSTVSGIPPERLGNAYCRL